MIATGDAAFFAIAFMTAGVFLTVMFFAAAALVVVGHFKPSARMRRAGWIVLAVWLLPAAIWCYYLLVLTDHDRYRTLSKPLLKKSCAGHGPAPRGMYIVDLESWGRAVPCRSVFQQRLSKPEVVCGTGIPAGVGFQWLDARSLDGLRACRHVLVLLSKT